LTIQSDQKASDPDVHLPGEKQTVRFSAVVLAGSRGNRDPVAQHAAVPLKALAPVGGRPMILRVVAALAASEAVDDIAVVGLPADLLAGTDIGEALQGHDVQHLAGLETPSLSVASAFGFIPPVRSVLITTADHALLNARIVDDFVRRAAETNADVVFGLTRFETVLGVAPDTRRTVMRFRDGDYCGCNLFAFLTPASRDAVSFWRRVEKNRKSPLRIARELGPLTLLRYVFRRLTLAQAMDRLSARCGARVTAVCLPFGTAAIDVDKLDDLLLAERLAQETDGDQ
jgi:GTP:adenosylcobinamide-phosphate guanylyltransferase